MLERPLSLARTRQKARSEVPKEALGPPVCLRTSASLLDLTLCCLKTLAQDLG